MGYNRIILYYLGIFKNGLFLIFLAQGHLQGKVSQKKFQTGFVVAWGRVSFLLTNQLIKFEEDKRFGL